MTTPAQAKVLAAARVQEWRADPVRFVVDVLDAKPDAWQVDALRAVQTSPRVALSACKGPGKSCLESWVAWWLLATRDHSQGIATSITADNLRDGLWKELALWRQRSDYLRLSFNQTAERISSVSFPATWYLSARSFPQQADPTQQANTLAGLHAQSCVFVVMDEVGDYPDGVLSAAEGIFANRGVEAKLLIGGNPTSLYGPLYRVCSGAPGWRVIHITGDPDDPKRSPRISLEWAKGQIEQWGRDNPWVMVNVLGQFPPASEDTLIGINEVMAAQKRVTPLLTFATDPIIWGVDPARSGRAGADEACLMRRQGIFASPASTWRGKDGPELATAIAKLIDEDTRDGCPPDAIFVDVGGVGASCYDHLCLLHREHLIHPVDFGGRPEEPRFADKRAEMWHRMAEWLKRKPVDIDPSDSVLAKELQAPRFKFKVRNKVTVLALESKDEMKSRGVPSPNRADALALTFADNVAAVGRKHLRDWSEAGHARTEDDQYRMEA